MFMVTLFRAVLGLNLQSVDIQTPTINLTFSPTETLVPGVHGYTLLAGLLCQAPLTQQWPILLQPLSLVL